MSDTDTVIASLHKNTNEELRVMLTEYQGHPLFAARVFYHPKDSDEWRPGKSGVNLRVAMLPAVIDALLDAKVEAERRGLPPSREAA